MVLESSKFSTNDHINDNQLSQIMSSNIRAARFARSNARVQDNNSSILHRPRTLCVAKEMYPISHESALFVGLQTTS